jgi:hypothetical protein
MNKEGTYLYIFHQEGMVKRVIILSIGGIVIFLFGFFAGGYWTALKLAGVSIYGKRTAEEIHHSMFSGSDFWGVVFFGAHWENTDDMKPPPEGKGYLTGTFIYQGTGAGRLKCTLYLNSEFRTSTIMTDDNGSFEIRLPVGTWQVNMIQCEGWANKPQGEFLLVSGDEARMDESPFQDLFFRHNTEGKEVVVSNKKPAKEHLVVTIKPRIKTIWPKATMQNQQATIAHSTIKWEPYPGAAVYALRIDRVTRENKTRTSFSPILYRKVSGGNTLPLKDLPHTKGHEMGEYAVTIRAYDQEGIFIGESLPLSGTFSLTDKRVLFSEEF